MNVLLVYPEYPDTFWTFRYALKFIAKKATYPPLGLLTVAAMLPETWTLRLVDMNVTALSDEQLRWADLVCISAMSIQSASVRALLARCRAQGVRVLAGGPLFTAHPDAFADVDYLVLNEAELTLPRFLHDFAQGQAQHLYTTEQRADLRATPVPRWELIDARQYAAMNIQFTRGCPFDCEFCNITTLFGRVPRVKDTAQILTELDALYQAGWRGGVFFVDDNLIGNPKKAKTELLPALITWMDAHKRPFHFNSQVSVNLADDEELLALLVRAGFVTVFIGIETPNEASLAECNKTPNAHRDLLAHIRKIQRAGLQVQAGFIVGFDNDPLAIFERLTNFIQESGIVTAMVGLLNAPVGTRLYQRLQAEGRLLHDMTGDNTDSTLNFIPKMDTETLIRGYRSIVESIYAPHNYHQRVRRFLQDFHPVGRRVWSFRLSHLYLVAKMSFVLGVLEQERVYYWRLLFWSLFTRPRLLPMAVEFTAYGFHFRKSFARGETSPLS